MYAIQLVFRLALFATAVYLFVTDPATLDASATFGIAGGFDFVDFVFLALLADFCTKFFERAHIAAGSLKQYRIYQIPTALTQRGGREALHAQFDEIAELGRSLAESGATAIAEIYEGLAIRGNAVIVFVGGWYAAILLVLAFIILVRWELAALQHPERFDELTNARLTCAQCADKLCYLRKPLTRALAGDEAE